MCLEAGQYTLEFLDSEGDGICCQFGEGAYSQGLMSRSWSLVEDLTTLLSTPLHSG